MNFQCSLYSGKIRAINNNDNNNNTSQVVTAHQRPRVMQTVRILVAQ